LTRLYPYQYNADQTDQVPGGFAQAHQRIPADVKQDRGYQLDKVQRGQQPDDFKPMPSVGQGVEEIRVWDDSDTYRVIYTARLADAVYVLHAFHKKTQRTARRDKISLEHGSMN
jgi:phage-related protein